MVSHAAIQKGALLAVVLLGLGVNKAGAQTNTDAPVVTPAADSRVVGTWELVSLSWTTPDGRVVQPWGSHPEGRISYDAHGNVMGLIMHERRNEAQGGSRAAAETLSQYSAYFGTYRIDPARGVITHHVTGSLNGENASGELQRTFTFEGDMLVLGFTKTQDGVPVTRRLVWKRMS